MSNPTADRAALARARNHRALLRDFARVSAETVEDGLLLDHAVRQAARAVGVGRASNTLQSIQSLLIIRRATLDDARAVAGFDDVMGKVAAISTAHDLLQVRDGRTAVSLRAYLAALCRAQEVAADGLSVKAELDDAEVRVEVAVPVGLVLSELLTNAANYACDGNGSVVRVRLVAEAEHGEAHLSVQDKGPGMGGPRPWSAGLGIVRTLAAQLGGHVDVESSAKGTNVSVRFALV